MSAQQKLWSDLVDALADLSLHWVHIILLILLCGGSNKSEFVQYLFIYEPRHDQTNKMSVRPAMTQISLGIRPVWSVFAVRSMGS